MRWLSPALATAVTATTIVFAPAASAAGSFAAMVFPDTSHNAVYSFINSATTTLDMTMYELRDTTAQQDLAAAAARGVTVKVILDGKHTSVNGTAYSYLNSHGVHAVYSWSKYYYTHEKSIVVDGSSTLIMSGNLDSTYYGGDRDYGVIDPDPVDAAAVQRVFDADYAKTSVTPGDGDNLVWSPTDSQNRLLALIDGAQHSLQVEELEFGDTTLVNALVSAAQRGVDVRVVGMDDSSYYSNFDAVTAAGGSVVTYSSTTGLYIHAKAIVADAGTSTAKAFAGSINFSDTSLNSNRELGLITTDAGVLSTVGSTIATDFANGTPY
jgi:phosphatidylserine/phosphatidylglycerophosphate/cardiolipin synthase-like enzyme